jgi:predicted nuclease of predicted toxin-antitoxin system
VNRLLLDQGLPRSAVRHLEERGFDVRHVADIGYSRASDAEITVLARDQGRTIVTLDSDFHRLLAISGASAPSVIRIRREGLRGPDVAALVSQVLGQLGDQIERGAMVTVTERTIRLHRLPLRKVASKATWRPTH